MAKQVEAFSCDPDFCPRCGSILPLPGLMDVVMCSLCDFKRDTAGRTLKFLFEFSGESKNDQYALSRYMFITAVCLLFLKTI